MSARGWHKTTDIHAASFIWFQNKDQLKKRLGGSLKSLQPWQSVNHFGMERELGHKGRLLSKLHEYHGVGKIPYMPESYRLWEDSERARFLAIIHRERSRQGSSERFHPWIMKEAHLDNGQGISIISERGELVKLGQRVQAVATGMQDEDDGAHRHHHHHQQQQQQKEQQKVQQPQSVQQTTAVLANKKNKKRPFYKHTIAQRYLEKPLLTADGHKFDLRMYWLVASVDPLVIFYHDGYMRVSIDEYTGDDFSELRKHLTNAKVQKVGNAARYRKDKELTRRPFAELGKILRKLAPEHADPFQAVKCKIQRAFVDIAAAEVEALQGAATACPGCFSLLGADFMIDREMNVWLSEVQSGPGLPTNTATTRGFMWRMLPNAVDLVMEVRHLRETGQPLWPLRKAGDFELIVHQGQTMRERGAPTMAKCNGAGRP